MNFAQTGSSRSGEQQPPSFLICLFFSRMSLLLYGASHAHSLTLCISKAQRRVSLQVRFCSAQRKLISQGQAGKVAGMLETGPLWDPLGHLHDPQTTVLPQQLLSWGPGVICCCEERKKKKSQSPELIDHGGRTSHLFCPFQQPFGNMLSGLGSSGPRLGSWELQGAL